MKGRVHWAQERLEKVMSSELEVERYVLRVGKRQFGWAVFSAVMMLAAGSASAYALGERRSVASTEIFGYDQATLPRSGVELRTDVFVTITGTNKTFHLDDLSVRGYERSAGTAGAFSVGVMEIVNGRAAIARDGQGRELKFHWYDVPQNVQTNLVRTPGWYDADGKTRWENLEFQPGQSFVVQGSGLKLETFGLVLDAEMRMKVPCNRFVAVGQGWAKHANLCDMSIEGRRTNNVAGGVVLQTLLPSLECEKSYFWYSVTNGVSSESDDYREPGWYADASKTGRYARDSGIAFDMGRAFWVRGCQADGDEAQGDCEYVLPKLRLFMKDYEPWSEQ